MEHKIEHKGLSQSRVYLVKPGHALLGELNEHGDFPLMRDARAIYQLYRPDHFIVGNFTMPANIHLMHAKYLELVDGHLVTVFPHAGDKDNKEQSLLAYYDVEMQNNSANKIVQAWSSGSAQVQALNVLVDQYSIKRWRLDSASRKLAAELLKKKPSLKR